MSAPGGVPSRARTAIVAQSSSSSSTTNLIGSDGANKPIGITLFGSCFKFNSSRSKQNFHKALVLLLTFLAYTAFHMGRRPLSVVKNVLNRDCSRLNKTTTTTTPTGHQLIELNLNNDTSPVYKLPLIKDTSCDWAPFDNDATANQLLAYLDTAFLLSYAIFMFFSGFVAERTNLRYFISLGCIISGFGLIAFGLSYPLDIHSMVYFITVQIVSGAAQTTGWPVVVTCVSNWFDKSKLGTIYGLWNSHTNLGNILGAMIAGYFVESDWGLSFMVPGVIMISVGIILFLFLAPAPKDVNILEQTSGELESSTHNKESLEIKGSTTTIVTTLHGSKGGDFDMERNDKIGSSMTISTINSELDGIQQQQVAKPVSFCKALQIPGVIEFSFCLFFSKLVSYTFLYWLPRYITSSTTFNSEDSAYLSTPFDIGGIVGSILAGYLSDRFKVNGIICNIMLICAIPSMFAYQQYGAFSSMHNILLQLIVGLLVNGPYCLITTAVSADLGNRIKNGHAMATVSAIIDGMGSVGAVLGPLFAGFVSSNDWQSVFIMLMISDVLASLCIVRITVQDIKKKFGKSSQASSA